MLGELLGASNFISCVVLAAVLLCASPERDGDGGADATHVAVNRGEFLRDVLAYVIACVAILAIAIDGNIHLFEVRDDAPRKGLPLNRYE